MPWGAPKAVRMILSKCPNAEVSTFYSVVCLFSNFVMRENPPLSWVPLDTFLTIHLLSERRAG